MPVTLSRKGLRDFVIRQRHAVTLLKPQTTKKKMKERKRKKVADYCPAASTGRKKAKLPSSSIHESRKKRSDQITKKGEYATDELMGAIQAKSLEIESIGYRESGRERSQGSQLKPSFLAISFHFFYFFFIFNSFHFSFSFLCLFQVASALSPTQYLFF